MSIAELSFAAKIFWGAVAALTLWVGAAGAAWGGDGDC